MMLESSVTILCPYFKKELPFVQGLQFWIIVPFQNSIPDFVGGIPFLISICGLAELLPLASSLRFCGFCFFFVSGIPSKGSDVSDQIPILAGKIVSASF